MVDYAGGGEGAVTLAFPRWGEGGSAEPDEGRPYGGSPLMGKPPGRGRVCPARNFTVVHMYGLCRKTLPSSAACGRQLLPQGEKPLGLRNLNFCLTARPCLGHADLAGQAVLQGLDMGDDADELIAPGQPGQRINGLFKAVGVK